MESLRVGVDDIDRQYTDLWDKGLAEPGLDCCVLISVTASFATPRAYIITGIRVKRHKAQRPECDETAPNSRGTLIVTL